jgi:hypothetical protein
MKKALTTLIMGLALVSCSTPEPRPTPMQLDFSGMGKLYLSTEDVRVVNRAYSTPQHAPYIGHLFEPRLADAVNQWGVEHLKAVGQAGHATLIIKEASVQQQALPMEGGMDSWFTRQQAMKYVGRVEVAFEAQNPQDHSTGLASAQAVYSVSIAEEPTEVERYAAYKTLVDGLMKNLNQAFTQSVKERMGRFLTSAPAGGDSFGMMGSSSSGTARTAPVAPVVMEEAPPIRTPSPAAATARAPTPVAPALQDDGGDPSNPIVITSP